jgi:hypothetical protein
VSRINATTRASAPANRQTVSRANTANTADIPASQNLTSSGSAPGTDRTMRDPGSAAQDKEKLTSSPRVSLIAASRSSSYDRRTFNGAPSPRFAPGGGYHRSNGGSGGGGGMRGSQGGAFGGGHH